jgi:hypothetical protein
VPSTSIRVERLKSSTKDLLGSTGGGGDLKGPLSRWR